MMAEFDTSSYPKPQPPGNPFDMISNVGKAADVIGNIEVGKGVQQALGPDGQIDRNKLAGYLGGSTAGAMKAIPTLDALEKLRTAGFGADAAGLDTLQKRFALTSHFFSGLASNPKATIKDVNDIIRQVSDPALGGDKLGINVPLIMNLVRRFYGPDGKPLSSSEIQRRALELQTQAASSAEVLAQHSPKYAVINTGQRTEFVPVGTAQEPVLPGRGGVANEIPPGTPVINDKGQPQLYGNQPAPPAASSLPVRQKLEGMTGYTAEPPVDPRTGRPVTFNDRFSGEQPAPPSNKLAESGVLAPTPVQSVPVAGAPRGPLAGNEPGFDTATQSEAQTSATMANSLRTAANESPNTRAILRNIKKEVENFTPGPGADYKRFAKSFALANLPIPESLKKPGAMFDPASIADQESFNKQVYQLAQSQFNAIGGTGTDAKLTSAMHTSPNELMSRYGIKTIVAMLEGNQDAIEAKNRAYNAWRKKPGNGPQKFAEFSEDFNSHFDPRVFQFKYMPQADRQKYFDTMDAGEQQDFLRNYNYAKKAGWVNYGAVK